MFKLVSSFIGGVLGRKRALDDEGSEVTAEKKQKIEPMIHRVKVDNLPERDLSLTKKYFKDLGYNRFKKAPNWSFAYITVDDEAQGKEAVAIINKLIYKGQRLIAVYTAESEQAIRNAIGNKKGGKKGKKNKYIDEENDGRTSAEKLSDQVTPLWRDPYEVQLFQKNRNGIKQLMNLKRKIAGLTNVRNESQRSWAFEKGALPCEVLDPIPSPQQDGYRTKCEFTIGYNLDNEPTVGFLLGLYRDGVTSVLEPSECVNISDLSKKIAKVMGDYVRRSDLPAYDRIEKTGCWRTLMTKTQSTGDILVLVQIRAADLSPERLQQEKQNLIKFWDHESGIKVTTLIFQVWDGNSNGITDKAPMETLTGDGYIYEVVLGKRFRLSASAFFQVNTPATEILYAKCAEWCGINKDKKTTLLDLCCGTGTIGITMADSVERVIGIEMVPEAIVDAEVNAKLNNIKNVTYHAAKVEDRIHVVQSAVNEEVIAILDPPRNGVHSSVIRAIREANHITRCVFVACDAKQAIDNFVQLCRPTSNRFKGVPFKPVRAVSVDLFPHTDHCELMIEFERVKEEPEIKEEEAY